MNESGAEKSRLGAKTTAEKLRLFAEAMRLYRPQPRLLQPTSRASSPSAGQVWRTRILPNYPPALLPEEEERDPVWVVILTESKVKIGGRRSFLVAPIFAETEYAGPDDILFPKTVLGFRCAIAVGAALSIIPESLLECEGALPHEWCDRLFRFQICLETGEPRPTDVRTGLPYLDENDVRFVFMERMVERLDYLQAPLLDVVPSVIADAERVSVADKVRAIVSKVKNWITVPDLQPFIALQMRRVTASSKEVPKFEITFKILGMGVFLEVSVSGNYETCTFQVRDKTGEVDLCLDGGHLVSTNGEISADIDQGQTRLSMRGTRSGFAILTKNHRVLQVKRVSAKVPVKHEGIWRHRPYQQKRAKSLRKRATERKKRRP